ncbi:MAG: pseudouridylate synthase [Deltaproteobacteria bacterium]|nr:pseudouridylate synthase [Deltaproteobacteria bacterium]MBW2534169.1 pseudouridylate synthase [Deltaproteobacteria bacterium]
MLVHRGWGREDVVVVDLVREITGRPAHPLHRLDRGASGVLAFACTPAIARQLQPAFHDGRAHKRYLALVRGHAPEHLLVDHPIPNKPRGPRVDAVTEIRLLGVFERYSLVEARPRTGRLHQIRRHLKHLSLPVIGDANYGKSEHNRLLRERFGLNRLALHCLELELEHPRTGAALTVRAPLPPDLAEPLERMGLSGSWER